MSRLRILLDVDGVLADFLTPALATINRKMKSNHRLEDMRSWHLFDAFGVPKKLQDECYDEWKAPGWCRNLSVYSGAKEGVDELRKLGDVFIVTSPMNGETWTNERERWLAHHFAFDRKHVIHAEPKWVCSGDVLIDDKTDTLVQWGACHPDGVGLRWRQVTNVGTAYQGVTVDNWKTVARIVSMRKPKEYRSWTHK